MSIGPQYSHEHRLSQNGLSRQGFAPIPAEQDSDMQRPGEATYNIPLENVQTSTSYQSQRQDSTARLASRSKDNNVAPTTSHRKSMFAGHRRKKDPNERGARNVGYDGEEDTVNRMGMIYRRFKAFSIITRYSVYVVPVALCIAVPIIVGATNHHAYDARIGGNKGVSITWFFTWIEIVWLSLWVSKVITHYLPTAFQILAGVVSSGTRKYALVIKSLEIPLSLVGWAVTSLATFAPMMTLNPDNRARNQTNLLDWESVVQQILGAAVVAAVAYLVEKTFIQLISINYHRKQFNARIKDSKHHVFLLGVLYEASRALFPMYCPEFAEEDYIISDQLDLSVNLGSKGRSHARSGSATPIHILQDVGRIGDKITSAFGNVASEITGKQVFNPNSAHSVVVEALERTRSCEALARRIWMSLVIEGKESLSLEDIIDVLGLDQREYAEEAFAALDRDGNGDVSLDETIMTISEYGRERKAIATSMHDVDQAINVLDRMLMLVVLLITILVLVAFLNANFVTTLATTGTALLSLSFVFSVTAQEVLGSCIFLFVKHPFDIGDRVDINADQLLVEHISLLYTVFRRISGTNVGRLVQIPNIVLNTLWIENVSRSNAMKEQVALKISFDTSFEDIQTLKNELLAFVSDKENTRDFQNDLDVEVLGTSDMSSLELRVEIRHKSNWSNETVRAARRSKFMCALVQALRRVPIYGPGGGGDPLGSATNASYSVAIPDSVAAENRQDAADKKAAARLQPLKKETSTSKQGGQLSPTQSRSTGMQALGLSLDQENAIEDLNARNPAVDAARDEAWTSSREDASTLGERPSIDPQDLEDMRGLLRRESTKGRRRPDMDQRMVAPKIPTITEPPFQPPIATTDFAQQAEVSLDVDNYERRRAHATVLCQRPAQPYTHPALRGTPSQGSRSEMSQMSMARSPSNPYRQRSESTTHRPPVPMEPVELSTSQPRPYEEV